MRTRIIGAFRADAAGGSGCTARAAVFTMVLLAAAAAHGTTCVDVCGSGSGDCHISTTQTVTAGSLLDCSGRSVFVDGPAGDIQVTDGVVTLMANDLTVAAGRHVSADRTVADIPFGVNLLLTGTLRLDGTIDAAGANGGGAVAVIAAGDIVINNGGSITASGTGENGDGGTISLSGSRIEVGGPLAAAGGVGTGTGTSHGGNIAVMGGTGGVLIDASIDASGGEAGAGAIDEGGITVTALGDLAVAGGVDLVTRTDQNDGDGGDVTLEAGGALTVSGNVNIDARGHSPRGGAGSVTIEGCTVTLSTGSTILGNGAPASEVHISGIGSLAVAASIDATSAQTGWDGAIELTYRVHGSCSNNPALPCTRNSDCVVGCQTGTCSQPITQGGTFTPAVRLDHDPQLPPCE